MRGCLCLFLSLALHTTGVRAAPVTGGAHDTDTAPGAATSGTAVPSASSAEPPSATPTPAPARQWYGWQILLADATTVGATWLSGRPEVLVAGYLALPPLIHLGNAEAGRAAGSFGLRVALPLIFGQLFSNGSHGDDSVESFFDGLKAGAVLASLVDSAALAWRLPASPDAPDKAPPEKPWVGPYIQPLPRGVGAGLSGAF